MVAALTCLSFVLLLTPTGSLPSRRWRWWAWATAAAPVACLLAITLAPRPFDRPYQAAENPLDVSGLTGPLLVIYQLAFAVTNLAVLVGAASLVVRFRRARGTERQQLRWVTLAAALALLASVVVLALSLLDANPVLLGWVAQPVRRSRWATAAASPRLATPSLARMLETCTLAVLSLMNRASAI